jgi:aspartate carbamoyltransferase catalytic subunit
MRPATHITASRTRIKCLTAKQGAIMSNDVNGWNEYSKLVLKELETLAKGIDSLRDEIVGIKEDLVYMKSNTSQINELKSWKTRVDDVASPTQLKEHIETISELKAFKTKAITVFAVVQFLMGVVMLVSKFLN